MVSYCRSVYFAHSLKCLQCTKRDVSFSWASGLLLLCCRNMPSSFKGADGKIVYSLEAKLSRSMRVDQKDSTKINFVSKVDPSIARELRVCDELHLHSCHSNRLKKDIFRWLLKQYTNKTGSTAGAEPGHLRNQLKVLIFVSKLFNCVYSFNYSGLNSGTTARV